jgi:hypothetical protein
MKRFLLITSAMAMLLIAAWAQPVATGTVKGSLTLNGSPLAGAAVVVSSSGDSSYTAKITTDGSGNFIVLNAPLGTLAVKAYDAQGVFLVSGTGTLSQAGDVVSVTLSATR